MKTGDLLIQEKIWNIFKNFSHGKDFIEDKNLIKNYLLEKKYNIPQFDDSFPNNKPIQYKALLNYFNAFNILK